MRAHGLVVALVIATGVSSARADGGLAPAKDPDGSSPSPAAGSGDATTPLPPLRDPSKGPFEHKGQFGVSLRLAEGLRGIATYHNGDYCGATSTDETNGLAAVCLSRSPIALELEMAYGAGRHLDVLLEMKLGLESDFGATPNATSGPHTVFLSPGLRYFFAEGRNSKLFTTAQAVFDFTDYTDQNGNSRGTDFGVRNLNGLWFDLHRAYGFYVFAGETLSVVRWLDLDLEIGVGLQARYP